MAGRLGSEGSQHATGPPRAVTTGVSVFLEPGSVSEGLGSSSSQENEGMELLRLTFLDHGTSTAANIRGKSAVENASLLPGVDALETLLATTSQPTSKPHAEMLSALLDAASTSLETEVLAGKCVGTSGDFSPQVERDGATPLPLSDDDRKSDWSDTDIDQDGSDANRIVLPSFLPRRSRVNTSIVSDSEGGLEARVKNAIKQLPGIASPDELRNWGPCPWGRMNDTDSKPWSFPLLQTACLEAEPVSAKTMNPLLVASRESVRRKSIIFTPVSENEEERKFPSVAYDWRVAQKENANIEELVSDSSLSRAKFSQGIIEESERKRHALKFESRFESGNLLRAVQIGPFEYDLFVRADVNTKSYMQWWYFAVTNTHPSNWKEEAKRKAAKVKSAEAMKYEKLVSSPTALGVCSSGSVTYKFNIVNLCKPDSMYNQGMKPVSYSCIDAENMGKGWKRDGSDICYFPNHYTRVDGCGNHYTLTFKMTFDHPSDTVLLAHSVPFTYTDHLRHIKALTEERGQCIRRTALCKTLAERQCDLLTITDFQEEEDPKCPRRAIVITARVHPGETPASWIMKGFLDFCTGSSDAAKLLRKLFVFKVVPMLNPDGVFYGNNRCNLSSVDLNRQWSHPSPMSHPTIYHTKTMISNLRKTRSVVMYLDIHAHSRKNNIFMYGVEEKNRPVPSKRLVPMLMSSCLFTSNYFSYKDSHFKVTPGRESTARVVVAKELHISNSFTIESTFCGMDRGPLAGLHLNTNHLEIYGMGIGDVILQLYHPGTAKRSHVQRCLDVLQTDLYRGQQKHSRRKNKKFPEQLPDESDVANGTQESALVSPREVTRFSQKQWGEKLGLGVSTVSMNTSHRQTSRALIYTNFEESSFIRAAEVENFEIFREVFSPGVRKKKGERLEQPSRNAVKNRRSAPVKSAKESSRQSPACSSLSVEEEKKDSDSLESAPCAEDQGKPRVTAASKVPKSTVRREKELIVSKRDIQVFVPSDHTVVTPPYKPMPIKHSSNFGQILHNLRNTARSAAAKAARGRDLQSANASLVSRKALTPSSAAPFSIPHIGFIQQHGPHPPREKNEEIIKEVTTNVVHEKARRSVRRGRRKKKKKSQTYGTYTGPSQSTSCEISISDTRRPIMGNLANEAKKNMVKKSNGRNTPTSSNGSYRSGRRVVRPTNYRPISNAQAINSFVSSSLDNGNHHHNKPVFLPSVGRSVATVDRARSASGEGQPLSPSPHSKRYFLTGHGGRIYRSLNDMPNFSPVRQRPAFF
jgi:cytosolic carboxypeptidase protein 2/3